MNELPEKRPSFKKGILIGILLTSAAFLLIGLILIKTGTIRVLDGDNRFPNDEILQKLNFTTELIGAEYIEEVPAEDLEDGLFRGLAAALGDPYARYFSKDEFKEQMTRVTRQYYGIGATLTQDEKTKRVRVVYVYDDSPAKKEGLKEGDEILSVNGHDATSMDLDALVELIQGDEGTVVDIDVRRENVEDPIEMHMTRAVISMPTVQHSMFSDHVGYIYITKFASNTPEEFHQALEELTENGMEALIIDLRYNTGGIFESCINILDELLPKGVLVYTENRNGERAYEYSDEEHQVKLPMAVLINEDSASASEIFAGAIRDYEWGTLIGTTTFGKGLVQQTFSLRDGSAFKLTVERYFTPSGDNIQEKGIDPDIKLEYDYSGDPEATEYDYGCDNQVQKAIELLSDELSGK